MRSIRLIALLLLLTAGLTSRAQLYRNDFDNGYAWYPPWENLVLAADIVDAGSVSVGSVVCCVHVEMQIYSAVASSMVAYNSRVGIVCCPIVCADASAGCK